MHRVERAGIEEHQPCGGPAARFGARLDIAHPGHATGHGIMIDPLDHRVGQHRQPAGFNRGRKCARLCREIGAVRTAARADRAVLAGRAAFIGLALGQVGGAPDRQAAPRPLARNGFAGVAFDHVERHRRLEFAIGKLWQALRRARYADELLDLVVPRRQIGIADRPVGAVAIALVGPEIIVRPAVSLPAPGQRTAAELVRPEPGEIGALGRRVGVLGVVDEVVLREFVEVAVERLHRVGPIVARGIALPSERHIPRRFGFGGIILLVPDFAPALDHQHLEASLGQLLGRPAAGDARADDDRIELHGLNRHQPKSTAVQSLENARSAGLSGTSGS